MQPDDRVKILLSVQSDDSVKLLLTVQSDDSVKLLLTVSSDYRAKILLTVQPRMIFIDTTNGCIVKSTKIIFVHPNTK